MASERIHNEYDATRIANAVDTLAENLAGYTPESPVTPTDAMKAKLPSQSTGDRIADAVESLAQNFNGSNTVVADTEVSPAENTHDIGTYLTYNGKEYVVLKYIDIDDPLDYESGDPNIEEVSLPDGTYIVTDDGDGEGGSGGGHTIINSSGTSMTARTGLKFGEGFNTADDSSNNQTVVTPNVNVIAKQSEISDVILTGDKPSSAIAEGKFFVDKNGLLRVATSSIGTTDDVDNTNSTVKSIGEVLGELNSKTTYSWSTNNNKMDCTVTRVGKVVFFDVSGKTSLSFDSSSWLGFEARIPSGYRPISYVRGNILIADQYPTMIQVVGEDEPSSSGVIQVRCMSYSSIPSGDNIVRFSMMWLAD